jgi:hypothetical protein
MLSFALDARCSRIESDRTGRTRAADHDCVFDAGEDHGGQISGTTTWAATRMATDR